MEEDFCAGWGTLLDTQIHYNINPDSRATSGESLQREMAAGTEMLLKRLVLSFVPLNLGVDTRAERLWTGDESRL